MTVIPVALAGAAAAVLVGLPSPRRRLAPPSRRTTAPRPSPPLMGLGAFLALVLPAGVVGAVVLGSLVAVAARAVEHRRARREREAERASATEALAVLAAELRAGRSPADALAASGHVAVGPAGTALVAAQRTAELGGAVTDALHASAPVSAVPDLLVGLAVCWQVCQGAGSSLAGAVDRLQEGLQAEQELRDSVDAELAGPRATAVLLACLPAFGLLLGAGLGAHPLRILLHTLIGQACLVVGVALDLLGLLWTNRIVVAAGGSR